MVFVLLLQARPLRLPSSVASSLLSFSALEKPWSPPLFYRNWRFFRCDVEREHRTDNINFFTTYEMERDHPVNLNDHTPISPLRFLLMPQRGLPMEGTPQRALPTPSAPGFSAPFFFGRLVVFALCSAFAATMPPSFPRHDPAPSRPKDPRDESSLRSNVSGRGFPAERSQLS